MAPTPKAACFVSRWMKPHAVWMDPHGTGGSRVGRITYPIPAWKKEFLDSSRYPSLEWKTWMFPKIEGVLFPPIIHGLNRGFPLFSPSILGYCTTIFGNTYMLVPSRVVYWTFSGSFFMNQRSVWAFCACFFWFKMLGGALGCASVLSFMGFSVGGCWKMFNKGSFSLLEEFTCMTFEWILFQRPVKTPPNLGTLSLGMPLQIKSFQEWKRQCWHTNR